ncbi:hypothetical protein [Umezawaea sp. NPDC059074]|uniref:hypothetical protein n=1 Tax=Umezawaea sp. NPDC059074 TaxID=3346716 RepID=UPI0036D09141
MTFFDEDKKSTAHLDGLKLAAPTTVGGGLFALYLAARRQRTQELELARRVTELFAKYTLERLAQDNADQRSTVVRVLCAYLRMPFEMPDEPAQPVVGPEYEAAIVVHHERVKEREVRIAAQRVLRDHLEAGDSPRAAATFWPTIDLDLKTHPDPSAFQGEFEAATGCCGTRQQSHRAQPQRDVGAQVTVTHPTSRAPGTRRAERCLRRDRGHSLIAARRILVR